MKLLLAAFLGGTASVVLLLVAIARRGAPGAGRWQDAYPWSELVPFDDWATDPYLTTLTEGGSPR